MKELCQVTELYHVQIFLKRLLVQKMNLSRTPQPLIEGINNDVLKNVTRWVWSLN